MGSGKLGVCEDHFYERYFESRDSLNSDAVPKSPVGLPTDNIRSKYVKLFLYFYTKNVLFCIYRVFSWILYPISESKAFSDASDITAGIFFINEEGKKVCILFISHYLWLINVK